MSIIEPCPTPWCEHRDAPYTWQGPDDLYNVICGDCQVEGPPCDTEAEAITAWNTRIEHTPSDRNAVLEEAAKVAEAVGTSFDTADNEALGIGELIRDVGSEIATAIRTLTTTPEPTDG